MSDSVSGRPAESRPPSERSPLLQVKLPESEVIVYGTRSQTSQASDADSHSSSGRTDDTSRQDEEANIDSGSHAVAASQVSQTPLSTKAILWIVLPMVLAVFVSQADTTIVMATHALIASEFMALESSSWLFTGFMLASTATQTTFGQLSEIFGRKPIIMVSYFMFGLGCLIVGAARTMTTAVLGRLLSGACSAGTNVLVSLVITDLLPMREVATWRAYINVIGVLGRCVGGPLGGGLADLIGWRMSFLGQVPLFLLAIVLCWTSLPTTKPKDQADKSTSQKNIHKVDFLGSALLATFLILVLLPLELGGAKVAWSDPQIPVYFALAALALVLLVAVEKWWASNPLLPLSMFHSRHTVAALMIVTLQCAAQLGMMFTVPLYFQVTQRMSNTAAGGHLLPAVIGNALGGIMGGFIIKRTGKYKWLMFLASLLSASCYTLLILRWHGNTNWLETLYIVPGGFGTGLVFSAGFIAVQAAVDRSHIAPAVSMLYLSQGFGAVVGLAATSAAFQAGLRSTLETRLVQLQVDPTVRDEIIANAVASVEYVYKAKGEMARAMVESYVDGLWYSHFVSLIAALLAFTLTSLLRDFQL